MAVSFMTFVFLNFEFDVQNTHHHSLPSLCKQRLWGLARVSGLVGKHVPGYSTYVTHKGSQILASWTPYRVKMLTMMQC